MKTDLIRIRESVTYPGLFVHKYCKKVFFKNLWHEDDNLLESRGRVYDSSNEVVINPFTKIFNYGENGTTIDDNEDCLKIEKINGFMACVTWIPELQKAIVSTTGSLDSDYVQMAKEMMPRVIEYVQREKQSRTYTFEIVHPNDPHIIPENVGVYLIGRRWVKDSKPYSTSLIQEQNLDKIAKEMKVQRPNYSINKFSEIKEEVKTVKHEGFMAYGLKSGKVLKFKSPYYLSCKAIARKKDILSLDIRRVDEEFYELIESIKNNPDFNNLNEQERLTYIREYFK